MRHFTSKLLAGAIVLSLAALYAGCSSSSGGGLRAFFGIAGSGNGTCTSITIRIDFSQTNLDPESGLVNCVKEAVLAAGCTVTGPTGVGSVKTYTISGCTFSDISALMRCTLDGDSADLADLAAATTISSSNCTNGVPGVCVQDSSCDTQSPTTTVLVVTTTTSTTTTVPPPSTTTTSTSSTSVTTVPQTTTTSTSTTLPSGSLDSYELTFRAVAPPIALGALQFDVTYTAAGGNFKGSLENVVCKKIAGFGALEAFNDCDTPGGCVRPGLPTIPEKTLSLGFADSSGFTPPRDLAKCVFQKASGAATPVTTDFTVTVTDASNLSGGSVSAAVVINSPIPPCGCGDGTVNCVEETCDVGAASLTNTCGDNTVNCSQCTDEECDDGNTTSGDGCSSACVCENTCGDGVLEAPCEECDPGYECQFGTEPAGTKCTPPDAPECTGGGFCLDVDGDSCNADCTSAP